MKKPSKRELEDILHNEELDKVWKEVAKSGVSEKFEEDERYWKEVLDPFYAEMMPHTPAKAVGHVVDKEIEEYKESDFFAEFESLEASSIVFFANISLFYIAFLLFIVIAMLSVSTENTCLSC